jgi:glycosyltransferase involved in cell wall biosynthesis
MTGLGPRLLGDPMPPGLERGLANTITMPLTVALDATPLQGPQTGIGEFCSRILEVLGTRPDLHVGAFAVSRRGRDGIRALLPPGVSALGPPGPGLPARLLHTAWARWAFPPAELYTGKVDLVHGTNFVVPPSRKAAMVVTVHDLSPLHFPQFCRPAARAYPELVKKAVSRGAWVHADSEFVAGEVVEALGVPAERVRAVHLGVTPPLPEPGTDGWRKLLPDWVSSYVLALGRVEPRKDLPTLVRAFGRVAGHHAGLALVIAGPDGWGSEQLGAAVVASAVGDRVLRLGWVDQQARDVLIEGATVFAYPSRYEGFGLPPLQAMASGTPVVASATGALKEVLGEAAWLVPVGDDGGLANALENLLEDPSARQELARKGRERAARYTWEACATGLARLYHDSAEARTN